MKWIKGSELNGTVVRCEIDCHWAPGATAGLSSSAAWGKMTEWKSGKGIENVLSIIMIRGMCMS